ncbi:aldo/keto reductase [Henriciella mobilis]|uniref:aldo/keto reductase n=1 Tax=Henriciella mobilis TaxID=2305467 RepID=UPI000E66CBE5|nr:aldo/keto reductase [Henriciella mobilis]RIJ14331.1 aldo/keto reductase [Henriciella mobilis]RIJ19841.1 aldo/keto reductase [Henriciella mobilis]
MTFSKRAIGGTDLNPVGLGCMSLSQAYFPLPSDEDGERLLNRALDLGYDHFDTARLYGLGHNEKLLSRVLKTRRDEVFLASKCGIEFDDGKRRIDCQPATIRRAVDKSLATLGVDRIDLYYLHRRDFNTPIEESVGALADLKTEGKIGAIGLSEMSSATLRAAHAEHPVGAMQTEYSLWTRNPELGVLETCGELGVAFVAFSPVARGALARGVKDPSTLPDKDLRRTHPRFDETNWPANLALVEQFNALADGAGITPAQLALSWVLSRGDHVHVIPGTASIPHLEENFETLALNVSQDVLDKADRLINQSTVSGHRYPERLQRTIDTEDFV